MRAVVLSLFWFGMGAACLWFLVKEHDAAFAVGTMVAVFNAVTELVLDGDRP